MLASVQLIVLVLSAVVLIAALSALVWAIVNERKIKEIDDRNAQEQLLDMRIRAAVREVFLEDNDN